MNKKIRVVIGMSGGVDSSTAAALLVSQGYDVIGIMLRLWNDIDTDLPNRCCSSESMIIARKVSQKLGIPFYVINARDIFYKKVVEFFIQGYLNAFTPNPCLECNQYIRWGYLLNHAMNLGADYFATGHYARIKVVDNNNVELLGGIDYAKDQSYVLFMLDQSRLCKTLLPLGEFTKSTVRQLAEEFDLPVANRKDSQDLCFLGKRNYHEFLPRFAPNTLNPGKIVDISGNIRGTHQGLAFYTVGQRKNLGITSANPQYVIEKNTETNQLVVGTAEMRGRSKLIAGRVNWISGIEPQSPFQAQIKIRYKANFETGVVIPLPGKRFEINFNEQINDVTPGQAAVIYDGEVCLGGGIIE